VVLACGYNLTIEYSGTTFFDGFTFFTGPDPTDGYVNYTSEAMSEQLGYISVSNNVTYISADNTTISSGSGRGSVRITSNMAFNANSLFIFDIIHMPFGCGTWPAVWLLGPNWPYGGEVDIIEGINVNTLNQATVHTSSGCTMNGVTRNQTGTTVGTNCVSSDTNDDGCGVQDTRNISYGNGFNNNGGGVYACEWTNISMKIWFFPRNLIPSDISSGNNPNPSGWVAPMGDWPLGGKCAPSHFSQMQIVVDDTFCGSWAGAFFTANGCGANCTYFVQNNPQNFTDAYWAINYFKVFN